jgi:hypothetical protein
MNVSKFQVDSQISLLYISPFVVFEYMFLGTQFNPQMFFLLISQFSPKNYYLMRY